MQQESNKNKNKNNNNNKNKNNHNQHDRVIWRTIKKRTYTTANRFSCLVAIREHRYNQQFLFATASTPFSRNTASTFGKCVAWQIKWPRVCLRRFQWDRLVLKPIEYELKWESFLQQIYITGTTNSKQIYNICIYIYLYTLEDNIEPTNHPFRKENDLPNLHDYVPC